MFLEGSRHLLDRLVAEHTCMAHRSVKTPGVPVTTQLLGGAWSAEPPACFR